jgi:hypothetical protein
MNGDTTSNSFITQVATNPTPPPPSWAVTQLPPLVTNNVRQIEYDDANRFPFTCDAGQPDNLGGFGWVQLEGMVASLDPCTTDIKNFNCP